VLEVNLVGLFELSRLAAARMIEAGGGSIINIASILGLVASSPIPNAAYCASKGAVINLTRELGCQWARQGVRVNAIAPGYFPSESSQPMIDDPRASDFVKRNCPMARFGEVHELDGVLLFLASDASTYCTGQVLTIDGGWTAR
jgi:NAD(P)-dependent dehydrogenase (short-subunit alcohol dehydrogenase family)